MSNQLTTAATREMAINHLVNLERRNPGTIWAAGNDFAAEFGGRWECQTLQHSFSTTLIFYAGDKKVTANYCGGGQRNVVVTPSFLGNLLRYLVEAKS